MLQDEVIKMELSIEYIKKHNMPEYLKIGSKVLAKEFDYLNQHHGKWPGVSERMLKFSGQILTIEDIVKVNPLDLIEDDIDIEYAYLIEECPVEFGWTTWMFERAISF